MKKIFELKVKSLQEELVKIKNNLDLENISKE